LNQWFFTLWITHWWLAPSHKSVGCNRGIHFPRSILLPSSTRIPLTNFTSVEGITRLASIQVSLGWLQPILTWMEPSESSFLAVCIILCKRATSHNVQRYLLCAIKVAVLYGLRG
jgi:hypothetical protein